MGLMEHELVAEPDSGCDYDALTPVSSPPALGAERTPTRCGSLDFLEFQSAPPKPIKRLAGQEASEADALSRPPLAVLLPPTHALAAPPTTKATMILDLEAWATYETALGPDFDAFRSYLHQGDGRALGRDPWPVLKMLEEAVAHGGGKVLVDLPAVSRKQTCKEEQEVVVKVEEVVKVKEEVVEACTTATSSSAAAPASTTVLPSGIVAAPGVNQLASSSLPGAEEENQLIASFLALDADLFLDAEPVEQQPDISRVSHVCPFLPAALMDVDGPAASPAGGHVVDQPDAPPPEADDDWGKEEEEDGHDDGKAPDSGSKLLRIGERRPSKPCRLCGAMILGGRCSGYKETKKALSCKLVWERPGMAAFHECAVCWECRDEEVPGKGWVCTTNQHLTYDFKWTTDPSTGEQKRARKCRKCSGKKKSKW